MFKLNITHFKKIRLCKVRYIYRRAVYIRRLPEPAHVVDIHVYSLALYETERNSLETYSTICGTQILVKNKALIRAGCEPDCN